MFYNLVFNLNAQMPFWNVNIKLIYIYESLIQIILNEHIHNSSIPKTVIKQNISIMLFYIPSKTIIIKTKYIAFRNINAKRNSTRLWWMLRYINLKSVNLPWNNIDTNKPVWFIFMSNYTIYTLIIILFIYYLNEIQVLLLN